MQSDLLPLTRLTQREIGRWHELARSALEPNPFFEPEYVLPLARGLSQLDDVALAVIGDRDAWLACCPVRRVSQWHRVPLPSVSVWRGHSLYSPLGTPLIARSNPEDAAGALIRSLVRRPKVFFAGFDLLVEDGPVYVALRTALAGNRIRSLRFERFERAFVARRPKDDYLEHTMSGGHRRKLRRNWRRLGEQLGAELQIVDRAGEDAAVTELVELEGRSYLAARGSVLSSNRGHVRFFREMCSAFAARGRLKLLALQAGHTTLAMKCMILASPGVFYFKTAYDERYASFSPGLQLAVKALTLFHEQTEAEWIDPCGGANNAPLNRMLPDRRSLVTLAAIDPTIRAIATVPAVRGVRFLRDQVIEARAK